MGCYVNPVGETKESWLEANARRIPRPSWPPSDGQLQVCLVQNRHFTAAGIAFTEAEMIAFSDPDDFRPKRWYSASIEDLKTVSPLADYLRGEGEHVGGRGPGLFSF